MATTNYYPKNITPDQTQGLTAIVPIIEPVIAIIVGHGIGERNPGDLAGCKESSGWGGWGNIKANIDKYGILNIYVNTIHDYEYGEYEFAVDWVIKKYPSLRGKIWILGHSLGSYGAGKYAFVKPEFAEKVAGWINSASGNFGDIPAVYANLVNKGCKYWGVTAVNDTVSGTNPIAVTRVYDKMKALNPNAHAILTVFPDTEWATPPDTEGSKTSHNAVLGRITQAPMYYSKGNISLITKGIPSGLLIKMNLYEWMISNPRGSIYQDPTLPFVGPKYADAPTPTNKTVMRVNITGTGTPNTIGVVLQYTDKTSDPAIFVSQVDTVQVNGRTRYTMMKGTAIVKQFEI